MADGNANPFSPRLVAGIVLGGCLAFLGFLLLTAYAPQLKLRTGEGATPMSRSAVGFYGLSRLAELSGRRVDLGTDEQSWSYTGFVIVTVTAQTDAARLRELVAARRGVPNSKTLYILPKWLTRSMPTNSRWVNRVGLLDPDWSPAILEVFGRIRFAEGKTDPRGRVVSVAGAGMSSVDLPLPMSPHYIALGMKPVLIDTHGRTILGRTDLTNGAADFILADPDLLSNMALKTPEGARNALQIVDALRADHNDSVAFDLALNGGGNNRNLLQLMFEPPFLALTLSVLAAALLAGLHAFNRFGPAIADPRAIPFGKRALADNAAVLIARAGAAPRMGGRYVAMIRDGVANMLGASKMQPEDLEAWLARLPVAGKDFGALAADAREANSSEHMRAAAAALHQWKEEVTRDRR